MNDINFEGSGIGKYISNNFLKVPTYQRSYAWEEQHIRDLLNDIDNSKFNEYFIGTLVVVKRNGYFEIIDGQQRLATVSIIFAIMHNIANAVNIQHADTYCQKYLSEYIYATKEHNPKLTLNDSDHNFYYNTIIKGKKDVVINKNSNERILKSFDIVSKFLNKKIDNTKDKPEDKISYIFELEKFLEEDLKIIVVTVSDEADAYTIFETLNDRGLALSQVDLIKNYLFSKSEDRLNEAQAKWSAITGTIEVAENEEEILQYVRYFWSSKYGLTRERELFRSIKKKIETKEQIINFLHELEGSVKYYLAILNSEDNYWNDFGECKDYISAFKELRLTQNRPLLLAILKQFDNSNIPKAVKLLVDWSVRNLITGKTSGTLEIEFSNQAKKITDRDIKNAPELKKSVAALNLVATDNEFKEKFKLKTLTKSYIARYYLRKIEEFEQPNSSEIETKKDSNSVTLEHILPQRNWEREWEENYDVISHKDFHKRIGNLTLLGQKLNSDEKSNSFDKKKEAFKKSQIIITRKITEYDTWLPADIEKRQEELADIAVKVWSLKL